MDINYLAVLACAVASMIIGSIWYGPLFGKLFMKEMGMNSWTPKQQAAMKQKMAMSYAAQFVASLVMFFVFAKFVNNAGELTIAGGLMMGLWIWIGFVVPLKLGETIWGGKMSLFWLGVGNMLVTLLVAGAIIGGF
ncbi:MAG: DUF1761 domain-containing protein [Candidatus Buchananbacteria bacterium]|nr:DUF1761 domain-containing protein [Candidatus Buchananbacteria bacterium]